MNVDIKNYLLVQKNKLNDLNNKIELILKSLENKKINSESILNKFLFNVDNLKNYLNDVDYLLDDIQYNFDIEDEELEDKVKKRIKNYEVNKQIFKVFAPYIIYLQSINL